jgi:hypothetical protein
MEDRITLSGLIQLSQLKYDSPVQIYPGSQNQIAMHTNMTKKNFRRVVVHTLFLGPITGMFRCA